MDGRVRLLAERFSHLPGEERRALAVMWASLLVFGPPALVLAFLNDPEGLPVAIIVVIGATVGTIAFSVWKLFKRR